MLLSLPLTGRQTINIFKNMPYFKSTSRLPVKLSYKFRKGLVTTFKTDSKISSIFKFYGKKIKVNVKMKIKGYYKILTVKDNGSAVIATTISKLNITAPGKLNYDSMKDKATEDPRIKFFNALVNNRIVTTIDKYGKLLKTDMKFVKLALKNLKLPDMQSKLDNISDQIIRSSFTMLPRTLVKAGMTYDSGTLITPIYKIGLLHFKASQKVVSVSADKKKVVLKPIGNFTLKALPGKTLTAKIKNGNMSGWILFNRSKGYVTESASLTKLDIIINKNKMIMPIKMQISIHYRTDI